MDQDEVARWAAGAAVSILSPRRDLIEDVWSSAYLAAWEATQTGVVSTWAGARLVAVRAGRQMDVSMRCWVSQSELRRGSEAVFRASSLNRVVSIEGWDLETFVGIVEVSDRKYRGRDAPSSELRLLRETLSRLVDRLVETGMDPQLANSAVETVVENPPVHPRTAARLRQILASDIGLSPVSARALTILMMGYPRNGIGGMLQRAIDGQSVWENPAVDRLISLIVSPRPSRLDHMWDLPEGIAEPAA